MGAGPATARGTTDAPPAVLVEPGAGGPLVVLCDHASNHVPRRFGGLGLGPADLLRHIAWDPGALGVARRLAARMGAALVAGGVSRLVIDCNRDPGAPDAITPLSETTPIPGNQAVTPEDRAWRIAEVHAPFHRAVDEVVAAQAAMGPCAVVAVHSFTPVYRGVARPWHVGVLFDEDRRLADPLLASLRRDPTLVVGANQPYSPADRVYTTLARHARPRGLPCAMVEVRQELLGTHADQVAWGDRLAAALEAVLPSLLSPHASIDQEPDRPAA